MCPDLSTRLGSAQNASNVSIVLCSLARRQCQNRFLSIPRNPSRPRPIFQRARGLMLRNAAQSRARLSKPRDKPYIRPRPWRRRLRFNSQAQSRPTTTLQTLTSKNAAQARTTRSKRHTRYCRHRPQHLLSLSNRQRLVSRKGLRVPGHGRLRSCIAGTLTGVAAKAGQAPDGAPNGRLRLRGPFGTQFEFTLAATAQNLRRLAKLVARPPPLPAPCVGCGAGGDRTACSSG